jgi:hypothetical protein
LSNGFCALDGRRGLAVPAAGAGDTAGRRFLEFFAATIRNKNTRMAYYRAVTPGSTPPASGRWSISSRSTSPPI